MVVLTINVTPYIKKNSPSKNNIQNIYHNNNSNTNLRKVANQIHTETINIKDSKIRTDQDIIPKNNSFNKPIKNNKIIYVDTRNKETINGQIMTPIKQSLILIRKPHTFNFRYTNNNNNKTYQAATNKKNHNNNIAKKHQPPVQYPKPKICSVK